MAFCRNFTVLLWKNALLKKRHLLASVLEILVPILFAVLLSAVRSLFDSAAVPVTTFSRWGSDIQRLNDFQGQSAAYFLRIQKKRLAIIPGSPSLQPVVDRIVDEISYRYPSLNGSTLGGEWVGGFNDSALRSVYLPGLADIITTSYKSEAALDQWLKDPSYPGTDPFNPAKGRVWAAIVIHSGPPHWEYSIRMNASEIPSTHSPYVDTLQREQRPWELFQYMTSSPSLSSGGGIFGGGGYVSNDWQNPEQRGVPGFLALQLLMDRIIINRTLPLDAWPQNEFTNRFGNAFWNVIGPASQTMWNEFYENPADGDWQRAEAKRFNMSRDVFAWARSDLYFPQGMDLAPMPSTAYTDNMFYTVTQYSLPMVFVLSFLFPVTRLIRAVVAEKEAKLREGLAMMGMQPSAILLSWLFTYEIQFLLVAAIVAAITTQPGFSKQTAIFQNSGFGPVFCIFAVFGTASVCYAAFVSIFFSKARTAATLGGIAYLAAFFPYYATGTSDSAADRSGKLAACILPPSAFAITISHVMALEGGGSGLRLTGPDANGTTMLRGFAFSDGMSVLAAAGALFAILAWYLEAILPSSMREFGIPLPWYFPCTRGYWSSSCACCNARSRQSRRSSYAPSSSPHSKPAPSQDSADNMVKRRSSVDDAVVLYTNPQHPPKGSTSVVSPASNLDRQYPPGRGPASATTNGQGKGMPHAHHGFQALVEPPDSHLVNKEAAGMCVKLHGLRKEFATPDGTKVAVDDVDMTMYEGQIFVLLGHNGAGKTTMISMLTGLIPPTAGSATVFGHDIGSDLSAIHKHLGICPQHDVLWPELTVLEHLQIFASVKALPSGKAGAQLISQAIAAVGLQSKTNARSSTLSGGQKRKLSVAIALLGDSKVVFLDEPTSGMDPYSRRATWQALQQARKGRVIVLTTHFMDEADILGDRIAIMSHGKLHSCGSPMFLKRAFGVGYNLHIVRAETQQQQQGQQAQAALALNTSASIDSLLGLIRQHVPEAELTSNAGRELAVRLPLQSSSAFPPLLAALEGLIVEEDAASTAAGNTSDARGAHTSKAWPSPTAQSPYTGLKPPSSSNLPPLTSVGIGVTTMEEVFLRVAHMGLDTDTSSTASGSSGSGPRTIDDQRGSVAGSDAEVLDLKRAAATAASPNYAANIGNAGFLKHFFALFLKRLLYARRDIRAACFQLLIPVVMVVGGLALLKASNTGDQPDLLLKPHFNTDPRNPDGPALYPNKVPAFTFKATGQYPEDSRDLDAILRTMEAGSNNPSMFSSSSGRLRIDLSDALAVPDPYNLTLMTTDGPYNDGWPSHGVALMSNWLVAEKELQQQSGQIYDSAVASGWSGLDATRDGGSIYGAILFTLNGSVMDRQDRSSAFSVFSTSGPMADISIDNFDGQPRADYETVQRIYGRNGQAMPASALTYALMVNTTAMHAGPIFANLVHESLYRLRLAADAADGLVGAGAFSGADVLGDDSTASGMTTIPGVTPGLLSNGTVWYNLTKLYSAIAADPSIGSIRVHSHPLPYTALEAAATSQMFTFGAAAIVTMAFAFVPAAHAVFIVRERETGAKHQQMISGASIPAYFAAAFAFDYVSYLLPAGSAIAAAWGFGIAEFTGTDASRYQALIALFLLYGLAVAPFAYLLSFAFKSHSAAQTGVLLISIASLLLMIGSLVMAQIPDTCMLEANYLRFIFKLLPGFCLGNGLISLSFLTLLPALDASCSVNHGIAVDMSNLPKYDALAFEATGWNLVFLGCEAVVYWSLAVLIDTGLGHPSIRLWIVRGGSLSSLLCCGRKKSSGGDAGFEDEDADVAAERRRIEKKMSAGHGHADSDISAANHASDDQVLINGLRKVYPGSSAKCCGRRKNKKHSRGWPCCCCCCFRSKPKSTDADPASAHSDNDGGADVIEAGPKVAVSNLSFGVSGGEVFGFLGINGAGKTTTLSILSGDALPTAGTAKLATYDIITQQPQVRRLLGYCPQFDALLDLLTVREHLEMYARIKGVTEADLPALVVSMMDRLDLRSFERKLAGTLSGGNKRKLSVAIALIGSPPVIFLDEPSTGMDPVAKRHMWKVIADVAAQGKAGANLAADAAGQRMATSIILTTHSMEEVEALCTRIGIMVGGRLRCLGTAQHLKNRHGQGYQLQLALRAPSAGEIVQMHAALVKAQGALHPHACTVGTGASGPSAQASVALHFPARPASRLAIGIHSQPSGSSRNALASTSAVASHAGDAAASSEVAAPGADRVTRDDAKALCAAVGVPITDENAHAWSLAIGVAEVQSGGSSTPAGASSPTISDPCTASPSAPSTASAGSVDLLSTPTGSTAQSSSVSLHRLAEWLLEERMAQAAIACFTGADIVDAGVHMGAGSSELNSKTAIFKGGALLERHGPSMRFSIPAHYASADMARGASNNNNKSKIPLSGLFATVESLKGFLGISSYGLSETTLEQVFNGFAAQQNSNPKATKKATSTAAATDIVHGTGAVTVVVPQQDLSPMVRSPVIDAAVAASERVMAAAAEGHRSTPSPLSRHQAAPVPVHVLGRGKMGGTD